MPRSFRMIGTETREEMGQPLRSCHAEGCAEPGLHRAPWSRERLGEYRWFCLDHVRAYNRSWDYYKGMDERAIEAELRSDAVWRRPTWRFAAGMPRFDDPFGLFGEGEAERRPKRPLTEKDRALATLGLAPEAGGPEIRQRYKALVKALHPDANGGDREAEERLKAVTQAYAVLKRLAAVAVKGEAASRHG